VKRGTGEGGGVGAGAASNRYATELQPGNPYLQPGNPCENSSASSAATHCRRHAQAHIDSLTVFAVTNTTAPTASPINSALGQRIERREIGADTDITQTTWSGASRERISLHTIVPDLYSGRTRRYHVKVQAPGSRLLTTQLYFPNDPANLRDGLFQRELLMRVADIGDGLTGQFDFVLDIR
jgi:hypothetical protein